MSIYKKRVNKVTLLKSTKKQRFKSLLNPHLEQLYNMAYRLTDHVADAEELVQELLIKVYARMDELEAIDQLKPWLGRVLYRMFVDYKRKLNRSPVQLISADTSELHPVLQYPENPHLEPDKQFEARLRNDVLVDGIAKLSEDHRVVILLHDVEGYTLEELQTLLDCPVGTLKSRLHRARARLRELIKMEPFKHPKRVNAQRTK